MLSQKVASGDPHSTKDAAAVALSFVIVDFGGLSDDEGVTADNDDDDHHDDTCTASKGCPPAFACGGNDVVVVVVAGACGGDGVSAAKDARTEWPAAGGRVDGVVAYGTADSTYGAEGVAA